MPNHAGRNEYVLSEVGKVYAGTHNKIAGNLLKTLFYNIKMKQSNYLGYLVFLCEISFFHN